jgi:uncharacterized protein YbcI
MKTKGEAESAIGLCANRFMQEYMGRGSTTIKTNITGDMVTIRLRGVLTETEQRLCLSEQGKELLKSVRRHLMNGAGKDYMFRKVKEIINIEPEGFYYDCDPINNEELIVFTFQIEPTVRQKKLKA